MNLRLVSALLGALVCIALLAAGVTQEVPRGSIVGVVRMAENGKPIPKALVSVVLEDDFGSDYKTSRTVRTDEEGRFSLLNAVAGRYSLYVTAKAHVLDEQFVQVEEAKKVDLNLSLRPSDPYIELYASRRVFIPGEKASFQLRGFDSADAAKIEYFRLDLNKIAAAGGLRTLLYSFSRPGQPGSEDPAKNGTRVGDLTKKLVSKDVEGVFTEPVALPELPEGLYYMRCSVGKQVRGTYFSISKLGLVTKSAGDRALCYVSDIVSGQPVSGASIATPSAGGLKQVGATGSNGLLEVSVPGGNNSQVLVVATKGKSIGVVDFAQYDAGARDKHRIFLVTDRPIYRPGDKVSFKGIVRTLGEEGYRLPSGGSVDVEVLDTNENTIGKMKLPVSGRGTFQGEFQGSTEDEPGSYAFRLSYGPTELMQWVEFAAYRKPEFSISVTPTQKEFYYGERASAKIACEYYFGGPVVGAKVEVLVNRGFNYNWGADDYYDEEGSDYPEDYGWGGGEQFDKLEVVTDSKGEATVTFPTRTAGDTEDPPYDFTYTVTASVTDDSGKYFEGQGSIDVYRGAYSVTVEPEDYILQPGNSTRARVLVTDHAGSNLRGVKVRLETGTEKWDGTTSEFIPSGVQEASTDQGGVASIPVTVGKEGSLRLRATVVDPQGRRVAAQSYIWVEGDAILGAPTARFTLTLDKKKYKIGDTCKALIQTDKPGGSALVTLQANKVLAKFVVKLDKPATLVRFPVDKSFAPNAYVSVVAVKDKQLLEAQSRLVVSVPEHEMRVQITSDKTDYLPGTAASVTIKTTDANGRGIPAELSLGVVDESIFAIRRDRTNIKGAFYPMRGDSVRTNFSFEEIYLDGGDKGGGSIPVRSKFKDTAAWLPTVETDENGLARTTIQLPDNLTSWRVTAVGASDRTQVGMGTVNFRVNKPLMVRLSLPSFLVQGDQQQISATVTNNTGSEQNVAVRIEAQGVDVGGETARQIRVTPGRPATITWNTSAPRSGDARFTVYAVSGDRNDAEERTIQVKPHGKPVWQLEAGEVGSMRTLTVNVSPNADKNTGGLVIGVSPTLLGSLYQGLEQLIAFPYGCVEQTMSRFLPTVVVSDSLKGVQVPQGDLLAKVPAMVEDGFARLGSMQHSDGSWGWWNYDEGDAFMTAYVLDGLKRAEEAGFKTNKIKLDAALEWGKKELARVPEEWQARSHFMLAYALARHGVRNEVQAWIAKQKAVTAPDELALMALMHHELGNDALAKDLLQKISDQAVLEGSTVRFKVENKWAYGVEMHALSLLAFATIAPADEMAARLARHLMLNRRGEIWYSTRDSAQAIVALTAYAKSKGEIGTTFDLDLSVNGTSRRISFTPESLFSADHKVRIPISELKPGENTIELRQNGSGVAYYSVELRQTVVADSLPAPTEAQPIGITRNYYLLESQKLEDGTTKLLPSQRPVTRARPGDLIRVVITLQTAIGREFIMVEDPIPSTCRITEREYVDDGETWGWWWSQIIVRDDRAAFFIRQLRQGGDKLSYTMRVEQIGEVSALPPVATNMYDPAQTSYGGETRFEVAR